MQITFNPLDPREVADVFNLLRILGAIDAGVSVEVNGEPTMTEAEARRAQTAVFRRNALYREPTGRPAPPAYNPPQRVSKCPPRPDLPTLDLGDL
jgi:sulfur carrier protein ThiS